MSHWNNERLACYRTSDRTPTISLDGARKITTESLSTYLAQVKTVDANEHLAVFRVAHVP